MIRVVEVVVTKTRTDDEYDGEDGSSDNEGACVS